MQSQLAWRTSLTVPKKAFLRTCALVACLLACACAIDEATLLSPVRSGAVFWPLWLHQRQFRRANHSLVRTARREPHDRQSSRLGAKWRNSEPICAGERLDRSVRLSGRACRHEPPEHHCAWPVAGQLQRWPCRDPARRGRSRARKLGNHDGGLGRCQPPWIDARAHAGADCRWDAWARQPGRHDRIKEPLLLLVGVRD